MSGARLHYVKGFLFPFSQFYQSYQKNSKFHQIEDNSVDYIEKTKISRLLPSIG